MTPEPNQRWIHASLRDDRFRIAINAVNGNTVHYSTTAGIPLTMKIETLQEFYRLSGVTDSM